MFLSFFFSLPLISTLVPACISYNLTAATKFSCCSSNHKKCLPVISLALFLVELRWPGAYFLVFSFFLLYFKFVDLTIKLSLILQTTRIQKGLPLSVFVFIDSLVVCASQDTGGYTISRQNNIELHLGCHTCGLSYLTFECLWCGRTGGRSGVRSRDIARISRMGRLPYFLRYGLCSRSASQARGALL